MRQAGWGCRWVGSRLRGVVPVALVALGVAASGSAAGSPAPHLVPAAAWSSVHTIPGQTRGQPTLVVWNGKLFALWAGTPPTGAPAGAHYSVWSGTAWSAPAQIPNVLTSGDLEGPTGIAAAAFNNRLYIAWMSPGGPPNSASYESFDGSTWSAATPIAGTSNSEASPPALRAFQGKLYLFWGFQAMAGTNAFLRDATFDGHSWSAPARVPHFQWFGDGPSLAVFNGDLQMAWAGKLETLTEASFDGTTWSSAANVSNPNVSAAGAGGSVVAFDHHLYVAWERFVPSGDGIALSERLGGVWTRLSLPNVTSNVSIAAVSFGGSFWLAWKSGLGGAAPIHYITSTTP